MGAERGLIELSRAHDGCVNLIVAEFVRCAESRRLDNSLELRQNKFDRLRVDLVAPEIEHRLLASGNH